MIGTPGPDVISTRLQHVAKLAKEAPGMAFTTLAHHMDVDWLKEAYRRTRKDAAPGVDGLTAVHYEQHLDESLRALLEAAKSGTYRAPPVRRVYIPKERGEPRPIGIPTFEDKVLQRSVAMLLEAVYEQDFLDCSYGFRPGRSAHQALETFWKRMMDMRGGWVLELDIEKFFDTLDHGQLRDILSQRVRDGVLQRLIGKWLNAGVLEAGELSQPDRGTPQGGVISPLLANIFLHEVLDRWFENEVKPRLRRGAFLVRYADDAVIGFASVGDARRVMAVLPLRLAKYGLRLHPEKTRLIRFRPPDERNRPGTFDFLGFTHHWARSRKGNWVIARKTAASRFSRALRRLAAWCRENRHRPVPEQHDRLSRALRGHYGYYGITANSWSLRRFRERVQAVWEKWLRRRGQRRTTWARIRAIRDRFPLPAAIAVHSVLRP